MLEIRVWVGALQRKLLQEKLFELMLHFLLIEMLQLINLKISKMLRRVKISLEIN